MMKIASAAQVCLCAVRYWIEKPTPQFQHWKNRASNSWDHCKNVLAIKSPPKCSQKLHQTTLCKCRHLVIPPDTDKAPCRMLPCQWLLPHTQQESQTKWMNSGFYVKALDREYIFLNEIMKKNENITLLSTNYRYVECVYKFIQTFFWIDFVLQTAGTWQRRPGPHGVDLPFERCEGSWWTLGCVLKTWRLI